MDELAGWKRELQENLTNEIKRIITLQESTNHTILDRIG
jgi:hypothetical protein